MSISKYDHKLIQALLEEVNALREENKVLKKLVRDLEEKLNVNSRNSSKSPSQDPKAQILSNLKSTGLTAGLLINLKERLGKDGIKRFVQTKRY